MDWKMIYQTADRTRKDRMEPQRYILESANFFEGPSPSLRAAEIIRRRRSAVALEPKGIIRLEQFLSMLDKTMPRRNCAPFDIEVMQPAVNLLLFVHGVEKLSPGLYFLLRTDVKLQRLQSLCRSGFAWEAVTSEVPLYLLEEGDFRQTAAKVSCYQEIAGDGAFSLGMIAHFRDVLKKAPYHYPHLYWETGLIGQVLYLEAEAHGVRGTGIGCYFDDPVHEILGLKDNSLQSLYHFTVGRPVEDPRVKTLAPYYHLQKT
jgi:nitroreductase